MVKMKLQMKKNGKISGFAILLFFLFSILSISIWIILFQFTKTFYEENTTLLGFIPWSDAYFMFFLLFMILPTTFLLIVYYILSKKR
jgi:hypothetical protein